MKILLISSSTKTHSSTKRAVFEAQEQFKKRGALSDVFLLGNKPVISCTGCGCCKENQKCIHNDVATELSEILDIYDGYVFFTPVHYGGASGNMISALGRIFISKKKSLEYKPASAVTVSRRGGNFTAVEEVSRFFAFASMPYVTGNYPGIIHGTTYDEVKKDLEGLQTIRSICDNMVWLINCINEGKKCGFNHPIPEEKIKTSYIEPIL